MCLQCYKAQEQCICDEISDVEHKTLVTIIQHPRERTHPFGTARITRHALSKVWVETFGPKGVWAEERSAEIEEGIRKRGKGGLTALFYPSPDATLLSELIEEDKPTHIVVLDGTWNHAKKLYAGLPFLQQLPKVMLEPERPSEYQIRQEPAETYVSTIEAIYYALRQLEPQNKQLEALLHPFRELIARQ